MLKIILNRKEINMIRSNKARFVILALATASLILATTSAGWRDAFAAVVYQPGTSTTNFIACSNKANLGSLTVTLAQGKNVIFTQVGSACETAIDLLPSNCRMITESQEVKGSKLSTFYRILCP